MYGQPLSRKVRGDLLEKGDAVLEVRALVGAHHRHALDESTLSVGGVLRELDRLLQLGRPFVRGHEDGKVVLTHREIRIERR